VNSDCRDALTRRDGTATIKCTKCGAPNQFDAGAKFMRCGYCENQIYIDKSGAGFFYILPFQLGEADAQGVFKRWAAGSERAKDLERASRMVSFSRSYFPVFMFRRDTERGEEVFVQPARSTTLPGLHSLKVPPGDLRIFDQKYDHGGVELMHPNIEMVAYLKTLPGAAKEQALVYFPIYLLEYVYDDERYQLVIDGSSGEVFSADYPPRRTAAYYAVGVVGFGACLAGGFLIPWNMTIAIVALVLTVPPLFAASYYVAKNK
jgi:hypothetical protein